jgi:osmotically-inducible protein OsmY
MRAFITTASLAAALVAMPASIRAQERPSDSALDDQVSYRIEVNEQLRKYDIDVDVKDRVVTLKGDVATEAQKAEAARIAKIDSVERVQNDIKVSADADKTLTDRAKAGLSKTGQKIDDAWITTKVKWFVMRDDTLDKSEINVDTKANVVTLRGTVPTEAGRDRAVMLAKQTEGVKRVVDELKVSAAR